MELALATLVGGWGVVYFTDGGIYELGGG